MNRMYLKEFKTSLRNNLKVYLSSFSAFIILIAVVYLYPLEYSSYTNADHFAPVWYLITESGGLYGGSIIMIVLLIGLLVNFKRFTKKAKHAFYFVTTIFLIQILITLTTLYFVKDYFHNPRPSQLYFVEKGFVDPGEKDFVNMSPFEKRKYLQKRYDTLGVPGNVYPPIFNSWMYDTGYSFPSGHSQSGFFLGTIISFVLFRTNPKKYYYLIPLLWAILVAMSRVVIGIHYPIDVAAGAFIGLTTAFIVISLKKINMIFDYMK